MHRRSSESLDGGRARAGEPRRNPSAKVGSEVVTCMRKGSVLFHFLQSSAPRIVPKSLEILQLDGCLRKEVWSGLASRHSVDAGLAHPQNPHKASKGAKQSDSTHTQSLSSPSTLIIIRFHSSLREHVLDRRVVLLVNLLSDLLLCAPGVVGERAGRSGDGGTADDAHGEEERLSQEEVSASRRGKSGERRMKV